MNFRQMTDEQIGLILMGLRAIYVEESEGARLDLIAKCEGALAARGKRLSDEDKAGNNPALYGNAENGFKAVQ